MYHVMVKSGAVINIFVDLAVTLNLCDFRLFSRSCFSDIVRGSGRK